MLWVIPPPRGGNKLYFFSHLTTNAFPTHARGMWITAEYPLVHWCEFQPCVKVQRATYNSRINFYARKLKGDKQRNQTRFVDLTETC